MLKALNFYRISILHPISIEKYEDIYVVICPVRGFREYIRHVVHLGLHFIKMGHIPDGIS